MVDAAVVAAVVVVGAGADERVLGRLGLEVVCAGSDHRWGVQRDGGTRRCSRLERQKTCINNHVVLEQSLGLHEKCDRNQVHHDDVGTPKVPNPDFQPILSTSKF